MIVTAHAGLLLAVPIVTGLICLLGPRRRQEERRPGSAALVTGGLVLIVMMMTAHLCKAGDPFAQCFIVGVSLWCLLVFPRSGWVRGGVGLVWVVLMVGLSFQYVELVHTKRWSGHPWPSAANRVVNDSRLELVRKSFADACGDDSTVHPAGWLREMECAKCLGKTLFEPPHRVEVGRAWHSWYTRLFPVRRVRQDFWFTGGRPASGGERVVLRDVR